MEIRKRRKKNEIYSFMFFLNIIMGVIMLLIGGYLYSFYYKSLLKEYKSANEQFQNSVMMRHENDIQIMSNIMNQLSFSEGITLFRLDEQAIKSRDLIERLYQYTNVSQSFGQMLYCYHNDYYIYNSQSSFEIQMVLDKGLVLENTTPEELKKYLYDSQEIVILPEQHASGYMTFRYKEISDEITMFFFPVIPKKAGTVLYLVGSTYYDGILKGKDEDRRSNYLIYDGNVIIKRGETIRDTGAVLDIASDGTNGIVTIDGTRYIASTNVGESAITYVTLQPLSVFLGSFLTGQWGIFFFVIFSYVLMSIIIYIFRNRFGQKVKNITMLLNEEDESFSTIEKGIRSLDESKKAAEKSQFINRFICSEFAGYGEMLAAEKTGIKADRTYYIVVLLGERGNSNEKKFNDTILELLDKEIYLDGYGVKLISKNQSLFVIFGNSKADIREFLDTIFAIGQKRCEELIMSASNFHTGYESSSYAYFEADAAYDNRLLTDNNKIIYYESVSGNDYLNVIPDSLMQRLRNAIRTGQSEVVEAVVDEICEKMQRDNHSLLSFRLICNDIIHVILEEWKNSPGNELYSVYTLTQCMTIEDFKGVLLDVCRGIISPGGDLGTVNEDSMVPSAIKLINENYADSNFNMSLLAQMLGVSAVTLSVTFKNEMDISPSDYLATVRMEKAKSLLRHSEKKVKEVSSLVGYEDEHVFTRRFKKYTGKTPGQYRNDHIRGDK